MADATFVTTRVCLQRSSVSSSIQPDALHTLPIDVKEASILVWLDVHYSKTDPDYQSSLQQLHNVANDIYTFVDCDSCIDFLTEINDPLRTVILIVSGILARGIVPLIEDWPQLNAIVVFHNDVYQYKDWLRQYSKVKGIFTETRSLIECLEQIIDPNFFTMIDIIKPSTIDSNRLQSSFMYSQLLKEILLEMHAEGMTDRQSFIEYCHTHSFDKTAIEQFDSNYNEFSPVHWYSAHSFVYHTVNTALRTVDVDLLLCLIFFIGDLHKQLEQLHSNSREKERLIVYRGQCLTNRECNKLKNSIDGLISFNCFLSTSTLRDVSLQFAESNNDVHGCHGVLFTIEIDPEVPSSPFASISEDSQFSSESEVLFSTHTVFRINRVTIGDDGLHYVDLSLTNNHDKDIYELTIHRRKEIEGRTSLHRLGHLLYRMGKYNNAEKIYRVLLGIANHDEFLYINHYLARIDCQMGRYGKALSGQATSLKFDDRRNPALTADVYAGMGEASLRHDMLEDSLEYYKVAFRIADRSPVIGHHSKVLYLNNIGVVFKAQEQYDQAQHYFQKALDIALAHFPPTHPDIANLYQNIGSVYFDKKDFHISIDYQRKSLSIQQLSLPSDHPSLGYIHYDLSQTFVALDQTNEAIEHAQLALQILELTLPNTHPDVCDIRAHLNILRVIRR